MQKSNLSTPVQYLKGVGPKIAKMLGKLGILTIEDLIYYLPVDYEDRSVITPIAQIKGPEPNLVIKGEIIHINNQKTKGRFSVLKVQIKDSTSRINVIFFNQPFLLTYFRQGVKLIVSGKVDFNSYEGELQFIPKDFEIDQGNTAKIIPIYRLTEGLYAKYLRKIVKSALDLYLSMVCEPLPDKILKKYKFPVITEAISRLHFPESLSLVKASKNRMIFQEFFVFQTGLFLKKSESKKLKGRAFNDLDDIVGSFPLPFELTASQNKVLSEILGDLGKNFPMNRLLQGDVGSGKTVVAAIAAFAAIKNGYQAAFMAPTEILAEQHFRKLSEWFKDQKIELVTGTTQRKNNKSDLDADIVIGTHALLEEKIKFKKLGLVVIDEQHRFGVLQRSNLANKGVNPHLLFMTATPIPRSLAFTLYGDLDRSVIDEMPPGRKPVKTHYVTNPKRKSSYEFIRKKINEGEQVFVVCPLVSESESLDLKAAVDEAKTLQENVFPEFRVGLIHGRLKPDEKESIMEDFRDKKIQVLVATTVIEVGIDIPNASIMIIEHAERFGLSQLHQLRGRIGRGQAESFCFLMGDPKSPEAKVRIKAMLDHTDGFMIAEIDLKLRGPGDFCGVKQAGLPEFNAADIIRDEEILRQARDEAIEYLKEDPEMTDAPQLKDAIINKYGRFLGY